MVYVRCSAGDTVYGNQTGPCADFEFADTSYESLYSVGGRSSLYLAYSVGDEVYIYIRPAGAGLFLKRGAACPPTPSQDENISSPQKIKLKIILGTSSP